MSNKSKCITNFNKNIVLLMKELEKNYPDNGEVITLKNRMILLKNELGREKLIELCGKAIYNYKDKIINREEKFFEDFDNIKKTSKINEEGEDYKFVLNIFTMAINCYTNLKEAKKDELYNMLKILLISYIEYYNIKE